MTNIVRFLSLFQRFFFDFYCHFALHIF
jgi:hypothetical protein